MSGNWKQWAAIIAAQKKRIGLLAVGHTFNEAFDHMFNYWFYIPVIAWLGPKKGGLVMTFVSLFTCLAFIKFYDWAKQDWLGIEVAKEVRDYGPRFISNFAAKSCLGRMLWWPFSKIILFVLWAARKGGLVAFFALSVFSDPFITTVYFRSGKFNGMGKGDWLVFVGSVLVGNGYWTARTYVLILLAKFSYNFRGWTAMVVPLLEKIRFDFFLGF